MEECKKALTEVYMIINMLPDEIRNKISKSFIEMCEKEMETNYLPDIEMLLEEEKIMSETVVILGMIYRDYICSSEEKEKLIKEEKEKMLNEIKENEEKYSYENLFKNREKEENNECKKTEENQLVVIEKKWYTKIIEYFSRIIRRGKR